MRNELQWVAMINKRYKEILTGLAKNEYTADFIKAALRSPNSLPYTDKKLH